MLDAWGEAREVLVQLDGNKVLRVRELLGYGIAQAAEAAGVSKNSILAAEHGKNINPGTARKIAKGYGVTIADLVAEDRGLREVREKYRRHAAKLEAYCDRFESGQGKPEEFIADLPAKTFELGGLYLEELKAIGGTPWLVESAGNATLSGVPKEEVEAEIDAQLEQSQMRPAIQRYFAVGRRLLEATGDKARAEEMGRMERTLAGAAA
jgi:transcriptional regulator with XRE-family HTH domain